MTKHPFVATPNNGLCSSCGRSRISEIHNWSVDNPYKPFAQFSNVHDVLRELALSPAHKWTDQCLDKAYEIIRGYVMRHESPMTFEAGSSAANDRPEQGDAEYYQQFKSDKEEYGQ